MLNIIDHPLITARLNILRDQATPPREFRQNLREIASFLCYEAARGLETIEVEITTPLETMRSRAPKSPAPVLVSILRAGNGLLDGALDVFPEARVGFLGMYRDEKTLRPVDYYKNLPEDLSLQPVFVLDPMLATGHSALDALRKLRDEGARDLRLIALVAAPEGVEVIAYEFPELEITVAALDRELNEKGYILPGLGDAGDRIYNSR